MRELPTGTVTLLFTDVEGSTRLLDALGDRYGPVLAEHRSPGQLAYVEPTTATVREQLGESAFLTAHDRGRAMSLDEAVGFALARGELSAVTTTP